jgi:hypothetical protein
MTPVFWIVLWVGDSAAMVVGWVLACEFARYRRRRAPEREW